MSVNKALLIGNLTKDPEIRYTPSGAAVCNFSIACNERFKDKDGNRQEKVEYINIVMWRQLAEIAGKYLSRGSKVYLEGKITTRSYDDRDGNKKYITEIVADQMHMLGGRDEQGGGGNYGGGQQGGDSGGGQQRGGGQNYKAAPQQPSKPQSRPQQRDDYNEPAFNPDDEIPF